MIKAILIDDEEIALDVMEIVLLEVGGVTVLDKFRLVSDAIARSDGMQPDLIFLDIEMPEMNGLAASAALLAMFPDADIVYVTAHHHYAVDAFDTKAIGYLLKPVAKHRLVKTLERHAELRDKAAQRAGSLAQSRNSMNSLEPSRRSLSLKLLESMELYDAEGRLITWRTKKTKEMFGYLWHHVGTPVYRYRILEHLWPELDSERAQALFHTTMYYVRNTLKLAGFPEMIGFGDERYWMRTDEVACDVTRLEALIGRVSQASDAEELLSLYRGDYFETENYSWANSKKYELRAAVIRHLETWAEHDLDASLKERLLRRLLELHPYQEKYYDHLALHLILLGDSAAADEVNRLKETTFGTDLGMHFNAKSRE
ncbi:response regulator [Paenibacillus sp. YIM B09110]|uniref:response regulator n=1 Tax=Paenibacillus sp. YIM B09110 TaxID=3126102 RepID=UPI00301D6D42